MKIAHLVSWMFLQPDDGGRIKTASLASALARCGELHVIDVNRRAWRGQFFSGERMALPFGGEARLWSCLPGQDWASRLGRRWYAARAAAAARLGTGLGSDVAVADDLRVLPTALRVGARAVIAHTQNVESVLHREVIDAGPLTAWRRARRATQFERYERELLPAVDEVWGVRTEDLDHYRGLGVQRLRWVPNTLPDSRFATPSVGRPGRALFFGSLWWGPNREAVVELAALARRLHAARAVEGLEFVVAGRGDMGSVAAGLPPGLWQHLGFVDELAPLAAEAAAIVIPMRSGGGTKIKTLEALALGKPVVTTPEGAAGLDLQDGEHALVRELGVAFDRAVIEVLRTPAAFEPMARRGQRWIRDRFSQSALDRCVAEGLRAVGATGTPA